MFYHASPPHEEWVDVINDQNEVIDSVPRSESYARGLSHRIVHVLVIDSDRIYLVRRAKGVRYLPGFFCTSAGGHVAAGEAAIEAALRELKEEIGLDGPLELLSEFWFQHEFRVHTSLFIRHFDREHDRFSLSPGEVMDGQFFSEADIAQLDPAQFHPQLLPCLKKVFAYLNGERK